MIGHQIIVRQKFLKQYIQVMERARTEGYNLMSMKHLLAQNKMVDQLIEGGYWANMVNFWSFADDGDGNQDLIDLRTPSGTLANYSAGGLTKIPNIGYQANGSTGRIRISNQSTNSQNCFFFAKEYDNVAGSSGRLYGGAVGASSQRLSLVTKTAGNALSYTIIATGGTPANTDSSGYYSLVGAPSYAKAYRNGTLLHTASAPTPVSLVNSMNLLADYVSGADTNFSNRTIQCWMSGLAALESGISQIESIFTDYLNRL